MKLARRHLLLGAATALPLASIGKASPALWSGALAMGTGQPGDAFTTYGPAWGQLITKTTGTEIVYHATDGSGPNLLLIEEGAAQLGLCSLPVAIEAMNGTASWTAGAKLEQFRMLFPAFPSILQIVSTVKGPSTLAGLAGQTIGVGPAGGSSAILVEKILASQGVSAARLEEANYVQQINKLIKGELSACAFFGAAPVPAIAAAASGNRLRLIGFSEAEANHAARSIAGLTPMILKAGTFPGQTQPVASIGTLIIGVSTAKLPDHLAAAATLAALQHRPELAAVVPAVAQPSSHALLRAADLPCHPGVTKILNRLGYINR